MDEQKEKHIWKANKMKSRSERLIYSNKILTFLSNTSVKKKTNLTFKVNKYIKIRKFNGMKKDLKQNLEGKKDSLPTTKPFLGFVLRVEKIGGAGGGGGIDGFTDLLRSLFD